MKQTDKIVIEAGELELSFFGVRALDGLQIQIQRGQILSVIGPNGAGKTCLINCITGYYKPQRGSILFKDRNIVGLKPHQIARMGIGRTFQNPTTFPHMTTLDILLAAHHMHSRASIIDSLLYFGKGRREEIKNRQAVEEIISFTRIEELRKLPLGIMSYGQRKQVEIARALAMEPEVIFLDEPMSGLDEVMKEIVSELIINVHKKGMTIVLVEHDMQAVMELSQSIAVLDYGQKIAEGTPAEITKDAGVVSAYIGDFS